MIVNCGFQRSKSQLEIKQFGSFFHFDLPSCRFFLLFLFLFFLLLIFPNDHKQKIFFNHLTPKGDQHRISHKDTPAGLNIRLKRIKELIATLKIS